MVFHRFGAALLLCLAATGFAGEPTPVPRRIVSICLPGDQLLLELVPRERIAALSWLANDPDLSPHWKEAKGIPATHGSAEELVRLKPDLVLVGAYSTRGTAALLKRLGVPLVEIGVPNDFAELRAQIREVARRLGASERAEALLAKMDARLAAMPPPPKRPTALLYFQDGYTPGGHTFADAILKAAGFRNLGADLGTEGASTSLERVVMARPQFLILTSYRSDSPTLTEISARHPLLRKLAGKIDVVTVPFRDFACPDPANLDLVEALHRRLSSP